MKVYAGKDDNLDYSGIRGETVFCELPDDMVKSEADDIIKTVTGLLYQHKHSNDDRLLSILSALCVEKAIDIILYKFLPGYNKLLEKSNDFTFSSKISVLQALKLIPDKFLNSCHIIRKIRNEFSHNLEFKSFNEILEKKKNVNFRKDYKRYAKYEEPDDFKLFFLFSNTVIMGLINYSCLVDDLRKHIESNDCYKILFSDYS